MAHELFDLYEGFRMATTKNGITVYFLETQQPWIKVKFLIHAGAKDDLDGKKGTAHFVEHQTSNNVDGISITEFKKHFFEIGGRYSLGSTGYDNTNYNFSVPLECDNLDYSLNFFGKMLLDSSLDKDFERERKVIIEEYNERFPTNYIKETILKRRRVIFKGHSLSEYINPLGYINTIDSITIDDVREFYKRAYTPRNMSIIAAGGISIEEFIDKVENSPFSFQKEGGRIDKPEIISKFDKYTEIESSESYSDILKEKPSQAEIMFFLGLPGNENVRVLSRALDVVSEVFFEEIRENRGWSYGGEVDYVVFPEAYEVYSKIRFPWEHKDVIEDIINECIEKAILDTEKIKKQINRSVNYYKIRDENISNIINVASYDIIRYGKIKTYKEIISELESVKVEDVQEMLKKFRKHNRYTVKYDI